jgi:hypothetical protein
MYTSSINSPFKKAVSKFLLTQAETTRNVGTNPNSKKFAHRVENYSSGDSNSSLLLDKTMVQGLNSNC